MRAVVQRVRHATLSVDGNVISKINKGFMILLGVGINDTEKEAKYIADKIAKLRVFEDENGKMNLSASQVNGEFLLVSNFTLYGNTKGTNRPDFIYSARPEKAEPLYEMVASLLNQNIPTKTGIFGADMKIDMEADGPVTIIIDTEN